MTPAYSLVEAAEAYLEFRRELGYSLVVEGAQVLRFARFADGPDSEGTLTTELAVRWATLPANADPTYLARRLDIVRRFARWLKQTDADVEVPPPKLLGPSSRRRCPHIYSDEQIAELLAAAAELGPQGGLRPATYVTLFGLLASTGMRISEALGLRRADVDLDAGRILVRHAKFDKSRLIPLHVTVTTALGAYAERRDGYHSKPESASFFLTEHATSQKYHKTLLAFVELRAELGWCACSPSRHPPRIHDLRHTFAVRCLLRWMEDGADVGQSLHLLAAYLGHKRVTDTYWYLTAVPELLALVGVRFEQFAAAHAEGGGR